MTWSLVALILAATGAITFTLSAATGLTLALGQRQLDAITPAASARVLLGAAFLPVLVGGALMTAALAPSFGWILDHCFSHADLHDHPHLCGHHVEALPARTLLVLAALLAVRVIARAARLVVHAVIGARVTRALERIARGSFADGVRVLPFTAPQAFVVGAWRPAMFITEGLLSDAHREHLAPVLSHERAHLGRRDPLRRTLASFALAFHLPGIARWLDRRLARAQEMAADAEAARAVGSGERVATALVRLARAHHDAPRFALAFGASDIEARVTALLDRRERRDRPGAIALVAGIALLFAGVAGGADHVHHGVEMLLGVLGG
jgi:Zn-dependent protease with chaperone function